MDEGFLLSLLQYLRTRDYAFVTPSPETHRRVLARGNVAADLPGIFGWNLPFDESLLPDGLLQGLLKEDLVARQNVRWKSLLRVSSLDRLLFLHSGHPTDQTDAVFFGPDTYRFVRFIRAQLEKIARVERLVASLHPVARLTAVDLNPTALAYARVNATHAGLTLETIECSGLSGVEGPVDILIANPPYMMDAPGRLYRHGGDMHGAQLSLEWALAASTRLAPGGRLLLYTGSAIVGGRDYLEEALREAIPECLLSYEELDPDVFGEQLDVPGYEDVERIAAVGTVIRASGCNSAT